jgi:hypothetical protein
MLNLQKVREENRETRSRSSPEPGSSKEPKGKEGHDSKTSPK